jgi:peptide/nickel transport system permease protein
VKRHLSVLVGNTASLPITLFGLVLTTFLIGRAIPIDPVIAIAGDHAPEAVVAHVRQELGLDRPLLVQFAIYCRHLLAGDLGTSVMTSHSVTQDLAHFFPATFELATVAILIAGLVGIPMGVIAAAHRGSRFDHAVRIIATASQSMPIFVLGLGSLLIFYVKLGIAPGPGQIDVIYDGMVEGPTGMLVLDAALQGEWDVFWDAAAHLAQPALLLTCFALAAIARMTRSYMLDALAGEYIVTARAKGLSRMRILWSHAFGNIRVPLVTLLALSYASLLEGAVVTETVFGWPGLGNYLTISLLNADMNAVLGATLMVGTIFLAFNKCADLAAQLLDPRTR